MVDVIIPMGGKGTRMRPHTFSKMKPLLHVAGKPMLGHILDRIQAIKPDTVHFVISDFEDQLNTFLKQYHFNYTINMQKELLGDGHSILQTKDEVKDDCLVVFSDTIFETDLSIIKKAKANQEDIIWVKQVEDPRRFGVVFVENGKITKMIEKPDTPVSKLAIVGMYYIHDSKAMFQALEETQKKKITSKGEYRLIDALRIMIEQGQKIIPTELDAWLDCGTPETMLSTNRILLKKTHNTPKTQNSVIIPPVYAEKDVTINNSIIGPNVSIANKAVIDNSIIINSIIDEEANITGAQIKDSLIGKQAVVKGYFKKMNVGDNSQIISMLPDK